MDGRGDADNGSATSTVKGSNSRQGGGGWRDVVRGRLRRKSASRWNKVYFNIACI